MLARLSALLIALLSLAACSSSGELALTKPKTDSIRPGTSVALAVTAGAGSGSPKHVQIGVQQVRADLYTTLESSGVFGDVVDQDTPADYAMQIDLSNVRLISGSVRFWAGDWVGPSEITGDVTVTDQSSGLEVTSFTATGRSAIYYMSSESGFDDAVREFGGQVTQALE